MLHYRDLATTCCIIPVKSGRFTVFQRHVTALLYSHRHSQNQSRRLPFHAKIPVHPTIKIEMISSPLTLLFSYFESILKVGLLAVMLKRYKVLE